jgi:HSP20 family protein
MNTLTQVKDNVRESVRDEPSLWPPVDVIEDVNGITLYADLPGVPKDKLNLRVEGEQLSIEGEQLSIEGEIALSLPQGVQSQHAEVRLQRYRRAFTLSKELDADKVDAEFAQGLLRVRIPKAAHAQPRKIAVQVN